MSPSCRAFPQRDSLLWLFSDRNGLAPVSFQFACLFKSQREWGVGGDGFTSKYKLPSKASRRYFSGFPFLEGSRLYFFGHDIHFLFLRSGLVNNFTKKRCTRM